jgi:hypothetical protein
MTSCNKGRHTMANHIQGILFPTSVGRGDAVVDCLMGLTTSGGGEGVGLRGFTPLGTRVVDLNKYRFLFKTQQKEQLSKFISVKGIKKSQFRRS